jgi:hypothetical protein
MMEGDLQGAVSQAMRMGYYDSIFSYEADITVKSAYAMYSQEQAAATGSLGPDSVAGYLGDADDTDTDTDDVGAIGVAGDLEIPLMDQLSELLEKQREDALARAREPLGNLFDHYLETQAAKDESQAQANDEDPLVDGNQADNMRSNKSKPSFSDLLEKAAEAVDRTIANIMKNAFDNSLKSFI